MCGTLSNVFGATTVRLSMTEGFGARAVGGMSVPIAQTGARPSGGHEF